MSMESSLDLKTILLQFVRLRRDLGSALKRRAPANGRLWNLRLAKRELRSTFVAIVRPLRDWVVDCTFIKLFDMFGTCNSRIDQR